VIRYHILPPRTAASRAAALNATCLAYSQGAVGDAHLGLYELVGAGAGVRETNEPRSTVVPSSALANGFDQERCVREPPEDVVARLAADSVLADRLRVRVTPTFVGPRTMREGVVGVEDLVRVAGR
jgi:hypothetical protein